MTSERESLQRYKESSHLRLSDSERQLVWATIEDRITRTDTKRVKASRFQFVKTGVATVAAVVIAAGGFFAVTRDRSDQRKQIVAASNHLTVNSNSSGQISVASMYQKFLSFIPLLPTYTAGYKLTHTQLGRYLNAIPGVTSISFTATYNKGQNEFDVTEGHPNQVHVIPKNTSFQEQKRITIGAATQATLYKYNGDQTTVEFKADGKVYDVSLMHGTSMSLSELKQVCASIKQRATQYPDAMQVLDFTSSSVNELSFRPIRPGDYYVPTGFKLEGEGANIEGSQNSLGETYSATYRNGTSVLTVAQSVNGFSSNAATYKSTKINGVSVYSSPPGTGLTTTTFSLPETAIQVTISSELSARVEQTIAKSILTTAVKK